MKKIEKETILGLSFIVILIVVANLLTGCNYQPIDLTWKYDTAIIDTQDGIIEVEVESWRDYEEGDQLQILATDGTSYLVHASNVTLISKN